MLYHSIFFSEKFIAATSNLQGISAKNDSLLQIEEIYSEVTLTLGIGIQMYDGYFLFWLCIYTRTEGVKLVSTATACGIIEINSLLGDNNVRCLHCVYKHLHATN